MAEQTKKPESGVIKLDDKVLKRFNEYEQKQQKLVAENPFIEVVDAETYEIGKQRRTALLKGRTSLEKESAAGVKNMNAFKKWFKSKYDHFVGISKDAEEKQQKSVKAYEDILEAEKEKERQAEETRINEINDLIGEAKTELENVVDEMKFSTIDESRQKFDEIVESEKYDQGVFMEREFLFTEMRDELEAKFNHRVDELKKEETERLERLDLEQKAKINELYRSANSLLEDVSVEDPKELELIKKMEDLFTVDYDFGSNTQSFEMTKGEFINKAKKKVDDIIQEFDERQAIEREKELAEQKNQIAETREGLLDLIFQMNVDNYAEETIKIKEMMKEPEALLEENRDDWTSAMDRVKKSLEQKLEMISGQIDQHGKKVDQREKELIAIGFEKNESGDLTLDDDPDWTVADDTLWNMSDDDFDTYKSDVNQMLEENKVHNKRWDERSPEVESIGYEYHKNDKRFVHQKYPELVFPLDKILKMDGGTWTEYFKRVLCDNVKMRQESDKKEQERQERIATDKENLINAVKSVRIHASEIERMENDEMSDVLKDLHKSLELWKAKQIELIKNV